MAVDCTCRPSMCTSRCLADRLRSKASTGTLPNASGLRNCGKPFRSATSMPYEQLTSRQREVLQLIAEGYTTKDIAQRLNLSVRTVETHRTELMQRLDFH